MDSIIVLLGSPNDSQGNLSDIAKERANKAIEVYNKQSDQKIIATGGWGEHSNTTNKAHAHYLKTYLLSHGLHETDFLPFALSSNTVEDAIKAKEIVDNFSCTHISVVTSDFHVPRVRMIFGNIFGDKYTLTYIPARQKVNFIEKMILHISELAKMLHFKIHGIRK